MLFCLCKSHGRQGIGFKGKGQKLKVDDTKELLFRSLNISIFKLLLLRDIPWRLDENKKEEWVHPRESKSYGWFVENKSLVFLFVFPSRWKENKWKNFVWTVITKEDEKSPFSFVIFLCWMLDNQNNRNHVSSDSGTLIALLFFPQIISFDIFTSKKILFFQILSPLSL